MIYEILSKKGPYHDYFFSKKNFYWLKIWLKNKQDRNKSSFLALIKKYYRDVDLGSFEVDSTIKIRVLEDDLKKIEANSTPGAYAKFFAKEVEENKKENVDPIKSEAINIVNDLSITNVNDAIGQVENILRTTKNKKTIADRLYILREESYINQLNGLLNQFEEGDYYKLICITKDLKEVIGINKYPPMLKLFEFVIKQIKNEGKVSNLLKVLSLMDEEKQATKTMLEADYNLQKDLIDTLLENGPKKPNIYKMLNTYKEEIAKARQDDELDKVRENFIKEILSDQQLNYPDEDKFIEEAEEIARESEVINNEVQEETDSGN